MADKKPDQFYTRPPTLGKWEGFKIFLWNSETGQFLGRTGSSWGEQFMAFKSIGKIFQIFNVQKFSKNLLFFQTN